MARNYPADSVRNAVKTLTGYLPCGRWNDPMKVAWVLGLALTWGTQGVTAEVTAETVEAALNRQIDFYGTVVDQHGQPVDSVNVDGLIVVSSFPADAQSAASARSAISGSFEIHDGKGSRLTLTLKKDGFVPIIQTFFYRSQDPGEKLYVPAVNSPARIILWKQEGPQSLTEVRKAFTIPIEGGDLHIDLMKGVPVDAGGDVVVSLNTGKSYSERSGLKIPWGLTVKSGSGGVAEIQQAEYEALSGIADSIEWTDHIGRAADPQKASPSEPYFPTALISFVFNSQDNKRCGKALLKLTFDEKNKKAAIGIRSITNGSGSKSLEVDPGKLITIK